MDIRFSDYDKDVDRKFRLARIWSNNELKKISHLFNGKVINVSAGENIDKEGSTYDKYFVNASEFWLSNFRPDSYRGYKGRSNELLINLELPLDTSLYQTFDVVFNHTTLEHIFDVFNAFHNICLLSKDIVIIVVPFVQEQHENVDYHDYWRFTPTCLRRLFQANGMKVVYEAANNDFNAATYLFFVASRNPKEWHGKLPDSNFLERAGNWIGVKRNNIFTRFFEK